MYEKLLGMMGIVKMEEEEFCNIYNMYVVVILINKLILCDDKVDLIYKLMEGKFNVVVDDIVECYVKG